MFSYFLLNLSWRHLGSMLASKANVIANVILPTRRSQVDLEIEAKRICCRDYERLMSPPVGGMWRLLGRETDNSWGWCSVQQECFFTSHHTAFLLSSNWWRVTCWTRLEDCIKSWGGDQSVLRPQATTCPLPVYFSAALLLLFSSIVRSSRHI